MSGTTVGSQVNEYIYHGQHMIGEYDDNAGDWLWQEIPLDWGDKMLEHFAVDSNDVDGDENTTEFRQYAIHEDFQSTAWGLSETDGQLFERFDYSDPYGVSTTRDSGGSFLGDYVSDVFHRKRLHAGVVDSISGQIEYRDGWYSPRVASWLSRVNYRLFVVNPFQFAGNDPLTNMNSGGGGPDIGFGGGGGLPWNHFPPAKYGGDGVTVEPGPPPPPPPPSSDLKECGWGKPFMGAPGCSISGDSLSDAMKNCRAQIAEKIKKIFECDTCPDFSTCTKHVDVSMNWWLCRSVDHPLLGWMVFCDGGHSGSKWCRDCPPSVEWGFLGQSALGAETGSF